MAEIEEAARRANAWEFIETFTHGLKVGPKKAILAPFYSFNMHYLTKTGSGQT